MALEQRGIDLRPDAEHELLALALRFDRLGRELRDIGHETDLCRNDDIGRGIEHQANLAADAHAPRDRFRQEESHIDVGQIDEVHDPAAAGDDLARLGNPILDAAAARRLEVAVADIRLDPRDGCARRIDIGSGADDLAARCGDIGVGRRQLRARGFYRGGSSFDRRLVIVALLRRRGAFARKRFRPAKPLAGRIEFGFPLADSGERCRAFALPLPHLGLRDLDGIERLGELRLRFRKLSRERLDIHMGDDLAGFHQLAFFGDDIADAARRFRRDIDLERFQPAIATDDTLRQVRGPEQRPEDHGHRHDRRDDRAPDEPGLACRLRHCDCSPFLFDRLPSKASSATNPPPSAE